MLSPEYGTDLVTFYAPAWWGFKTDEELLAWARNHPIQFWTRILDSLEQAGISAIEMTFAPADRHSALAAFGSTSSFAAELSRRGLSVVSGFLLVQDWYPGDDMANLLTDADENAAFLAAIGATHLVIGVPIRRDLHHTPVENTEEPMLGLTAALLNQMAAQIGVTGIGLAVHTEAHSLVGSAASIDAIMHLTKDAQVSLCVDSAQLVLAGANPGQVIRKHADRIALAHWKDADGAMEPAPVLAAGQIMHDLHFLHMCRIGDGVVDWKDWSAALTQTPAHAIRLIELDASQHPVDELLAARRIIGN